METQIISPWLVYAIGIGGQVKHLFSIMPILVLLAFLVGMGVLGVATEGEAFENGTAKKYTPHIVVAFVLSIVICFIGIFLPSRNTLISMIIADKVTYEKLDKAGDITKTVYSDIKKDIFEILKEKGEVK